MNRDNRLLNGKLVLATTVVMGMAAAPVALNPSFVPLPNSASAQTAGADGSDQDGVAEERAEAGATEAAVETDADVYRMLGTTPEEAESADTHTMATSEYGPLRAYQAEVERGNLDGAAENLAAISKRPITEELVTEVNTKLGVDTRLTSQQIAEAASQKQDSDY
jgi:hypothetical protein